MSDCSQRWTVVSKTRSPDRSRTYLTMMASNANPLRAARWSALVEITRHSPLARCKCSGAHSVASLARIPVGSMQTARPCAVAVAVADNRNAACYQVGALPLRVAEGKCIRVAPSVHTSALRTRYEQGRLSIAVFPIDQATLLQIQRLHRPMQPTHSRSQAHRKPNAMDYVMCVTWTIAVLAGNLLAAAPASAQSPTDKPGTTSIMAALDAPVVAEPAEAKTLEPGQYITEAGWGQLLLTKKMECSDSPWKAPRVNPCAYSRAPSAAPKAAQRLRLALQAARSSSPKPLKAST